MLLNFGRHDVSLISGIDRKCSVKLLGILFDETLSFIDHVKCITKRATAKLYVVLRLRRIGFSIRELTLLYKALVLPTLTYCCSVWGGTSDENFRKIDRVQSNAVRLGIINEYTPKKDFIRISGEKLYRQIVEQGENHVLHEILPKRATGTSGLREKRPPVEATKFVQELRLFLSYTAFLSDIMFMFPSENRCSIWFWIKSFSFLILDLRFPWKPNFTNEL